MRNSLIIIIVSVVLTSICSAQNNADNNNADKIKDSLYIKDFESNEPIEKLLHAEPLYIDLIRDLGARKGEKEWNIGVGLIDKNTFDEYTALVEYEWAPIDRLGVEIELPFSLYYPHKDAPEAAPSSQLNSIKLATQYTFLVKSSWKTSMAIGYIHEFELNDLKRAQNSQLYSGNVFNPFFVAAKRWGNNFHTLLYTGPVIYNHFQGNVWHTDWQVNTNFHYMIPGTKNFLGIEFNKVLNGIDFDMTIRPQMRIGIKDNLLIGIVTGIPVKRENERFSSFLRLIYEPGHTNNH